MRPAARWPRHKARDRNRRSLIASERRKRRRARRITRKTTPTLYLT